MLLKIWTPTLVENFTAISKINFFSTQIIISLNFQPASTIASSKLQFIEVLLLSDEQCALNANYIPGSEICTYQEVNFFDRTAQWTQNRYQKDIHLWTSKSSEHPEWQHFPLQNIFKTH
jgi:hypothetical protein